ncbi:Fic/DOC family N-terminal domain-containing protein [Anaeromyxobacter sp. SG17]|uniref:Fic/DOC family N-terminal domain-containing protein n=1 Tax=Anaeromyxobacter sp. SG17 TaxID=2925405 RepID=UPI001F5647CB|nr:Fic/DOC family N-terminal domain-containing protein [Anaeromyxobacter sp. SG17]
MTRRSTGPRTLPRPESRRDGARSAPRLHPGSDRAHRAPAPVEHRRRGFDGRARRRLNRDPPRLASLEVLARRLLRAESVASSRIEGLVLSRRRLARAEAEEPDDTALSVLGNVVAMEHAVALGAGAKPLRLKDVLEIHRLLC